MDNLRTLLEREPVAISPQIHPDDGMFNGDASHYRQVGLSALRAVRLALLAAGKDDVRSLLDFACGFGRVLRVLKAAFPQARLTACDLDRAAVDFCARTFSAQPLYSSRDLREIDVSDRFDVIWCGSLLTHVSGERFTALLQFFESRLEEGGLLVFTTHGRRPAEWIRTGHRTYGLDSAVLPGLLAAWRETGFGYVDYPGRVDYGISLSSPSWVCGQIEGLSLLRVVFYGESAWHDHQDVVGCSRE